MASIPLNDLSRMSSSETAALVAIFQQVVESGHFMMGPHTRNLEATLGELVTQPHVACVANGTDALTLALQALGVSRDEKVITVANAGGYTTTATLRLGAQPLLADIDPANGQISPSSLETVLRAHPNTKVVVVTHLYGLMAPVKEIAHICDSYGVKLVEDCAQSIGASRDDRMAGSWGNAATFSFYPTKNLACLGDGGAVALRDAADADYLRKLAQYGWNGRYFVEESGGFNSRIDEIQAAILVHRMKNLGQENERRREIVGRYATALSSQRRMLWNDDSSFVGHLAIMVSATCNDDKKALEDAGVGTGVHYPITDHQQIAWKNVFAGQTSPNADLLTSQILTLPCFPKMTDDEVDAVCDALSQLQ
jgi:dTDP-4-amino-4,6-dideoxygalactose transaminase